MDAEVGIIGLGAMGSMTMWQLVRQGTSVLGFEQFHIGHDRSALGSDVHLFRTIYHNSLPYVPFLLDAYEEWLTLEEQTNTSLLTLTKGLVIGNPGLPNMLQVIDTLTRHSIEYDILASDETKTFYPQHHLLPEEIMVVDPLAGILYAHDAIKVAVEHAIHMGATVYDHTHVDHIEEVSDGVIIYANGKKYKVEKVVITTGPFIHELIPELATHIHVRRLIGTWFSVKDSQVFSPEQFPIFIREFCDKSIYGLPSIDGKIANVSLKTREQDKIICPQDIHKPIKEAQLKEISQFVRTFLPDLDYQPAYVKTSIEAYTDNDIPIIGYLPSYQHLLVATGFSGHGFKMAPVIGKLISQMIVHGRSSYDLEIFSPERMVHKEIS